jgi:hypothetical protein
MAKCVKIQRYHLKLFTDYLEKLRNTADGDGSLLDHVMILYGAAISNSDRHTHGPLPTLLVGGGSGTLKGGRHLVYPEHTPLTNLQLTMLNLLGVPAELVTAPTVRAFRARVWGAIECRCIRTAKWKCLHETGGADALSISVRSALSMVIAVVSLSVIPVGAQTSATATTAKSLTVPVRRWPARSAGSMGLSTLTPMERPSELAGTGPDGGSRRIREENTCGERCRSPRRTNRRAGQQAPRPPTSPAPTISSGWIAG